MKAWRPVTFSPTANGLPVPRTTKLFCSGSGPQNNAQRIGLQKDCQALNAWESPSPVIQSAVNNVVFLSDTALVSSDANGQLIEMEFGQRILVQASL